MSENEAAVNAAAFLIFVMWLVAFFCALAYNSTSAAVAFAALTYAMTHWDAR